MSIGEQTTKWTRRCMRIVNPDNRTVRVHRLGGDPSDLSEHHAVSGEDVLPGFQRPVSDFFPPRVLRSQ